MTGSKETRITRFLDRAARAAEHSERCKGKDDWAGAAESAYEAVQQVLWAASERYSLPRDEEGGLLDLATRLSRVIEAECLPGRVAQLLMLKQASSERLLTPLKIRRLLPVAAEIVHNLSFLVSKTPPPSA